MKIHETVLNQIFQVYNKRALCSHFSCIVSISTLQSQISFYLHFYIFPFNKGFAKSLSIVHIDTIVAGAVHHSAVMLYRMSASDNFVTSSRQNPISVIVLVCTFGASMYL